MSTLSELNEKLFNQLDRLERDLTAEQMNFERDRAKILVGISKSIVENKRLMLEITKHADDCMLPPKELPASLRLEL